MKQSNEINQTEQNNFKTKTAEIRLIEINYNFRTQWFRTRKNTEQKQRNSNSRNSDNSDHKLGQHRLELQLPWRTAINSINQTK